MINPHLCYILGFTTSLLVYLLGWSEYYPTLSNSLLFFLVVTIVAHFVLSRTWFKKNEFIKKNDTQDHRINPWVITGFLYFLWLLDFLYEGGIPLFKILLNVPFDYKKFGVPALHVLAVTLSSFYTVYLFHLFLKTKKKMILLLYAINLISAILILSRAMFFFNLASSCFIYLYRIEKISLNKVLLMIPAGLILLYLFGIVGTKRVSFESQSEYNPDFFLQNGGATTEFRESKVPKEFFWSYFYISSPIANLQLNILTHEERPITLKRILEFINNELLFESISKRVNKLFGTQRENEFTIKEQFNVSTVYSRSYSYLGWTGMIVMALTILILPYFYFKLIRHNSYSLEGAAILCTTFLFMSYDNTIRLMALGFQLVYPIIFPRIEKLILSIKKIEQ
jgi:oligosaccharide repeat unit polymerase